MMQRILYTVKLFCVAASAALAVLPAPAYAEDANVLTKEEAIMRISAADFMKKKISDLISWTIGYDLSRVSRVKMTPSINYVKAVPRKIPPDGITILEIIASVDDPGGLANIAGVRADLSSIGRLSNMMLVDNGLYGDAQAKDGIYTLQTSVSTKIDIGRKEVAVAVANKKGWLALAKTNLDITKNPEITETRFTPDKVFADGESIVTLTIKIENPGRVEDLKDVTVDLRALGYTEFLALRNDGKEGDAVAGDNLFALQFTVPDSIKEGNYKVRVGASNLSGGYTALDLNLKVYK